MDTVDSLRVYEATVLRPRWDFLTADASTRAQVLNWRDAPAESWDRTAAESYADMVVKWAVKVQRVLQQTDPAGVSKDSPIESLRFNFSFHVEKMIHLQKLGISVPAAPSDLEAILQGIGNAFVDPENPDKPRKWLMWILLGLGGLLGLMVWMRRR